MSADFINEHWFIAGIGWVHVLGNRDRGFDVGEPSGLSILPAQFRFRLAMTAASIVNGQMAGRVLARARLKPGRKWGWE